MYLNNNNFYYEIIVCQGRGKCSKRLEKYFYDISHQISHKFPLYDYHQDQKQEAFISQFKAWKKFNIERNDNPMAYFSEIAKRAFTQVHNTYNEINPGRKVKKPKTFSLSQSFHL